MFPDVSCDRLLEMISYFYARAFERDDSTQAVLAEELTKRYGREYSVKSVVATALEAQRLMRASDGSGAAFDKTLEAIRMALDLKTVEDARKAYVPLFQYSDTYEEHQVVVLLTATMLERLFGQLLLRMFVHKGKDWETARLSIKTLRGHREREKIFAGLAGIAFKDAVARSDVPGFDSTWAEIRQLRNKFMHGLPYIMHVSDAHKAFELAKRAFGVFANLHNGFCVSNA